LTAEIAEVRIVHKRILFYSFLNALDFSAVLPDFMAIFTDFCALCGQSFPFNS